MAISLSKGQNIALDEGLKNVYVGLGWDPRDTSGEDFDLDASCFMLTANGKVCSDGDMICYAQLNSSCGSVEHTGDNLTGGGEGDDEVLYVHLNKVPADIVKLAFTVAIYRLPVRS
jgi:tellurium resistance protein TerD